VKGVLWKNILQMADTTVSIRVIPFTGKKEDWPIWSVTFLARARCKGYRDVLLGKDNTPSDADEPAATATQAEKDVYNKVRKLNDLAYEEMILCIDGTTKPGKVAFGRVNGASTIDIQSAVQEKHGSLNNKFEPKTAPSRLRLQNLSHESYLQLSQDPDKWITELEELRMRIIAAKSELTEESLMEHALNNVPEMYSIEVSKLEDRLEI
jgi:hypothetical protein